MINSNTLAVNENKTTTVAVVDAVLLIQLAASMELSRMEGSELRQKYLALLPIATDEQFAEVTGAAEIEGETPEGCRVNVDFKLSAEQVVILKGVREDRVKALMAAKDEHVAALAADVAQKLVSMKVRVGAKKTSTTLRFEKAAGKPVGLLARLREMTDAR